VIVGVVVAWLDPVGQDQRAQRMQTGLQRRETRGLWMETQARWVGLGWVGLRVG
jgi:hypothetical protein